jgi:hypothetical protein
VFAPKLQFGLTDLALRKCHSLGAFALPIKAIELSNQRVVSRLSECRQRLDKQRS